MISIGVKLFYSYKKCRRYAVMLDNLIDSITIFKKLKCYFCLTPSKTSHPPHSFMPRGNWVNQTGIY